MDILTAKREVGELSSQSFVEIKYLEQFNTKLFGSRLESTSFTCFLSHKSFLTLMHAMRASSILLSVQPEHSFKHKVSDAKGTENLFALISLQVVDLNVKQTAVELCDLFS
jgi:hypothetical protein